MLGTQALTLSYTLAIRQGVAVAPFSDLFVSGYAQLFADMQNRERGTLVDPVLGPLQCVPGSYRETADPNKRDGVDVTVDFTQSYTTDELDTLPAGPSVSGLASDAAALDAALTANDSFKQEASKDGKLDILTAIGGVGSQIQQGVSQNRAALDDLSGKLRSIDEQADALESPQNFGIQQSARNLLEQIRLLKGHASGKRIVSVTQRYAKTLNAIAAENDMTLEELLRLNPDLASMPVVPQGAVVRLRG